MPLSFSEIVAQQQQNNTYIDTGNPYRSYSSLDRALTKSSNQVEKPIASEDIEKYVKHGIMPYDPVKLYNNGYMGELSRAQSAWDKVGNMLAQTLVSEVGIGTAQAISDTFDVLWTKLLRQGDDDYQNAVSAKLQEWREKFDNEVVPIYQDPDVNIFAGDGKNAFGNLSWYMANLPSVMSSLTLLVPSKMATYALSKTIGAIGKKGLIAANNAVKASKAKKAVDGARTAAGLSTATMTKMAAGTELLTNGLLMRTLENYQEARQVYNDSYSKALEYLNPLSDDKFEEFKKNKGFEEETNQDNVGDRLLPQKVNISKTREDVAKQIAKEGADKNFIFNYWNTGFDIWQLSTLRNIVKGGRLINSASSASIRRAERVSEIAARNKVSFSESEKLYADLPFFKRFKNSVVDHIVGGANVFLAEVSEGVEEGINYMATEEGMYVARTLLGKEKKSWDDRFSRYFQDPRFYESALWGVAGGVIFQGLGSTFNAAEATIEGNNDNSINEDNETTGERKVSNGFSFFDNRPEIAQRLADIAERTNNYVAYLNDMEHISKNENPNDRKDDGTYGKYETDADREFAARNRTNDFIAQVTLSAMMNGNYDLTREYFASEEVNKGIAEYLKTTNNETIDNEQAAVWQQEVLSQMDKVANIYENQIDNLNDLSRLLPNSKLLPVEFLQNIAYRNTVNLLNSENFEAHAETYENIFTNAIAGLEESQRKASLETYKELLQYESDVAELYSLFKRKQELEKDKENSGDLYVDILLKKVEDNINEFKKKIITDNTALSMAKWAVALESVSDQLNKLNKDTRTTTLAELKSQIIRLKTKGFQGLSELTGITKEDIDLEGVKSQDEELLEFYNKVNTERINFSILFNTIIGDPDKKTGLYSLGPSVISSYRNALVARKVAESNKKEIVNDYQKFETEIGIINNIIDGQRRSVINDANKKIEEIANKYGVYQVRDYIKKLIAGEKVDNSVITDPNDVQSISNALEVLNLDNPANTTLISSIDRTLARLIKKNDRVTEEDEEKEKKKTIGNKNQPKSNENKGLNNPPTKTPNPITSNGNGQISPSPTTLPISTQPTIVGQNPTSIPAQLQFIQGKPRIVRNDNALRDRSITLVPQSDGNYSLMANSDKVYNSEFLYDKENGVSIIDGNYDVVAPIVKPNEKGQFDVIQKGKLVKKTSEETMGNPNVTIPETTNSQETNSTIPQGGTTIPIGSPTITPTESKVGEEQANSSTGEVAETTNPNASNNEEDDFDYVLDTIVGDKFAEHLPVDEKGNIDYINISDDQVRAIEAAVANDVVQTLTESGKAITNEAASKVVKERTKRIIRSINLYKRMKQNAGDNALDNAASLFTASAALADGSFASVKEEKSKLLSPKINIFKTSADEFIKQYAENAYNGKVDEKYLVSVGDLIQICEDLAPTANHDVAKSMFNMIVAYLQSEEGKSKYIITDEQDVNNGNVVKNLNKTSDEINKKRGIAPATVVLNQTNILRDIERGLISKPLADKFFEAMAMMKKGDTVKVELIHDGKLHFIAPNGAVIGKISLPRTDNIGNYIQYEDGWRHEVSVDAKGIAISPTLDMFSTWFCTTSTSTPVEQEYAKLRHLIEEYKYGNLDIDEAIKHFTSLSFISILIRQANSDFTNKAYKSSNYTGSSIYYDYTTGYIDFERMFDYLVKLYTYTTASQRGNSAESNAVIRRASLQNWFNKLYQSYDKLNNIPTQNASVSYVSEGQVIKCEQNVTIATRSSLPTFKEGLSDKHEVRLGIVNPAIDGNNEFIAENTEDVSKEQITIPSFPKGNLVTAIFSRNSQPGFVQTFGISLTDSQIPENAEPVISNISKEILKTLSNWTASSPLDLSSTRNLYNLLSYLFLTNSNDLRNLNAIPLFRGDSFKNIKFFINDFTTHTKGKNERKRIELVAKDTSGHKEVYRTINFYIPDKQGNGQFGIEIKNVGNLRNGTIYLTSNASDEAKDEFFKKAKQAVASFIGNYAVMNVDARGISADVSKRNINNGFITRDATGVHVKIGDFKWDGNSYTDFITEHDLVRVNTRIGENGTNFNPRGDNQRANQVINIQLDTTTPVEESTGTYIDVNSNKDDYETAKTIILSDSENKSAELIKSLLGEDLYQAMEEVKGDLDIFRDILPADIIFDEELNDDNDTVGVNARVNPTGSPVYYWTARKSKRKRLAPFQTVVGTKFLNMISAKGNNAAGRRRNALRKLMHEKLHITIHTSDNSQELYRQIKDIYTEFNNRLNKDIEDLKSGNVSEERLALLREQMAKSATKEELLKEYELLLNDVKSLFTYYSEKNDPNRLYEEFLIESLTNASMYNYLNNYLRGYAVEKSNNESLFSKIAKFIAKLFNWTINDDSLYQKQLKVLQDLELSKENINLETNLEEENNSNNNTEEKQIEQKPVRKEVVVNSRISNILNSMQYDDTSFTDDYDAFDSALEEKSTLIGFVPAVSVESFLSNFDITERDKIRDKIENGEFNFKCIL